MFDLPYFFDNYVELHKVTQGPWGAMLLKKLDSKGIVCWRHGDNGFKVMSAKGAQDPADFKAEDAHSSPPRCSIR